MVTNHQPPDRWLPALTSEFVGRHTEVHRIDTLLSGTTRLLTLLGPGGIGKTRLAAEALRQRRTTRSRRIYWSRLARLARDADVGAVAKEVVSAVAKSDIAGRSSLDVLVDTITADDSAAQGHPAILVLDNCEHVLTGVGVLIANLLEAVPALTIVATSREPVGWVDEQILTVPPLPPAKALELFLQRAELTGRPIADDPEHIAVAEQICRHVDHNPLFIRLATARLLHRPPAAVLGELTGDADDKRLNWSHGVRAGIEERHLGVPNVIAWSYGLCQDDERLLLDRMSAFAAGYEADGDEAGRCGAELDAVVAVCAYDALPADDIEGIVERLVERSLVSVHITASAARYYLLESVRVFARDRLLSTPDGTIAAAELARRHRRYYRDKVVAGQAMWYGSHEQDWLNWARPAWDNILVAIETSLTDPAEAVIGLEIATILMSLRVPFVKDANRAITRLTERALARTHSAQPPPTKLRIGATAMVGWIALWQGRSAYTAQLLDECVALCLPDPQIRRTWRETAEIDIGLPAAVEFTWGLELMLINMDPRAIAVLDRARHKSAAAGDRGAEERCELLVALSSAFVGNQQQALDSTKRHLDNAEALGSAWAIAWAMVARAIALTKHGYADDALALAHEALVHHLAAGDTWTASWVLGSRIVALVQILADRLADRGDRGESVATATEIARLVGGFTTQHRSMGIAIDRVPMVAAEMRRAIEVASPVLGRDGYDAAANQGAMLRPEFDELQKYVLGNLAIDRLAGDRLAVPKPPSRWDDLSKTEREVGVLAAAGWPNSAIATRRGSSVRTVDAQVAAIRQKLMISSRTDIIWHIPDELDALVGTESDHRPGRVAS